MSAFDLPPITRRLGRSPRIFALASFVPHTTRVFVDVGTNHCILPIAVLRGSRAQRCIAIDKSPATLEDARRRLRRSHCLDRVELRQGDGLTGIDLHEVDVVCIAGLGPRPMLEILERAVERLRDRRIRLVLGPMRSSVAVRAFLAAHGFGLTADTTVVERGRSYEILVSDGIC